MELFGKKYVCNVCKARFKTQDELDVHMKTHAAQPQTAQPAVPEQQLPTLKCDKCGAMFTSQAELDTHMKTHMSPPPAGPASVKQ